MMKKTCETCMHSIIYAGLDDEINDSDKQFYVCMLTDADIEPDDICENYEIHCDTCEYKEYKDSTRCRLCNHGSNYYPFEVVW